MTLFPLLEGALREDGTTGASVPVPLSIALNCVEIGLCVVFFFDYVMRKKIFYSGAKHGYYKYTAKERKTKNRKTFDPKEKDMDLAYLPINVEGGDPLITDLWTNFELILACIVTANALACLITTSIYWMQVVPNVGRLLRPFFFLVKMVNVYVAGTLGLCTANFLTLLHVVAGGRSALASCEVSPRFSTSLSCWCSPF